MNSDNCTELYGIRAQFPPTLQRLGLSLRHEVTLLWTKAGSSYPAVWKRT